MKPAVKLEPPPQQQNNKQLSSPPPTPSLTKRTRTKRAQTTPVEPTKEKKKALSTPVSTRKRKRGTAAPVEEDINALPHNLGTIPVVSAEDAVEEEESSSGKPKRARRSKAAPKSKAKETDASPTANGTLKDEGTRLEGKLNDPDVIAAAEELVDQSQATSPEKGKKGRAKKAKANPYGLTPGVSPFPDWLHPTPEECQEVNDLLSKVHGEVKPPATIPAPSTTVSGCGEVPSILDALIRTLLSAATTGANSSRAFQGLVTRFGLLKGGVGKGSVNWDAVRQADVKDVFEAIKSGGLAANKSKNIKAILDIVYQENMARRNALVEAKEGDSASGPPGAENETAEEKDIEIARADEHVLSLDHLHALSSDDALNALIKYPGIGPKTASCVLLFCMQRPSFAVDTHVFRICRWLNWIPANATRNSAYSHCEVRVPDPLKYPLHQLLIRHGKTCPRCRAATGTGSEGWEKGCPIDHLVTRTGKRKDGTQSASKKKGKKSKKGRKGADEDEDENEDEESEVDATEAEESGEEQDDEEGAAEEDAEE